MNRILMLFVGLLLLPACSKEPEPVSAPEAADVAAGKAIAEASCTGCHAMDGRGKTADIPNLAAQPQQYLVEAMHAYREGRRHHAALQELIGSFSESDIRDIAGFYAALPPLPPETFEIGGDAVYQEGAEVAERCTGCHGERGISNTPGVPSLAGQQPAYLIVSTQEYASGRRGHAEKEQMLKGLQQIDI